MIPDATYASAVEPFATSNRFALGHRLSLRLDIFGRVRRDDGASSHRREKSLPTPRNPPHIILLEVAGGRRRR